MNKERKQWSQKTINDIAAIKTSKDVCLEIIIHDRKSLFEYITEFSYPLL